MAQNVAAAKKVNNKAEIKKMIDGFMAALCNKDIKKMISYYAADAVLYDMKPPFQTKGAIAWRHTWEACIGYFPDKFRIEISDLRIHAGEDVAFAHYMFRLAGPEKEHDAMQTWMRATTGYKRIGGKWKIVHEHGSLPVNPQTREAIFSHEI